MTLNTKVHTTQFARLRGILLATAMLLPATAPAYLGLAAARVEHLQNGMTLIVLEDHSLPVVSVQMLYRVGARNETAGATGLAHFLEHMAFRDSENFPDGQLVSAIYASGGEWHGYTWLDQTTYFATAPKENLDLLLRIEADRMTRLDISASDVDVERGAVITELHGYENDPTSVLQDSVMYLTFLAHPYRNNTIGWESDVAAISYEQVLAFYQQNYHPGNAILAVVGDVRSSEVIQQVNALFAAIPGKTATPPPHTIEPLQNGERRMRLQGELDGKYLKVVYRAPAANSPNYPAFLLAQDILGGGSGVSFLQNDWGTAVRTDSPLGQVTLEENTGSRTPAPAPGGELSTWFPPSAQDYVLAISGSFAPDGDEATIEAAIEEQVRAVQQWMGAGDESARNELDLARQRVLRQLIFDVETTEDAAHQLAFFAGLDALDALIELPQNLASATPGDVARVMEQYLRSDRRNIAWYVPLETPDQAAPEFPTAQAAVFTAKDAKPEATQPTNSLSQNAKPEPSSAPASQGTTNDAPALLKLSNGLPVLLQHSALSPTLSLRIITPQAAFSTADPVEESAHESPRGLVQASITANQPGWGLTTLGFDILPGELEVAISQARTVLGSAAGASDPGSTARQPDGDPAAVLQDYFSEVLGLGPRESVNPHGKTTPGTPLLLVLSGDFAAIDALRLLEEGFGDLDAASFTAPPALVDENPANESLARSPAMDIESTLPLPVAQLQLGYIVRAPAPGSPAAAAWQMALYIFSHGYEGRLGREAIGNRGLVYYIGSGYETDGRNGWITLDMGVDPDKLPAMKELLRTMLRELQQQPPSQQEADEARQHLLGRYRSAAQSNSELADRLARDWLWYGQPLTLEALQHRLDAVERQDVIDLLPDFTAGTTISILNPQPAATPAPTSPPTLGVVEQ